MIPEINISITDPPRERWRLSKPSSHRARELILRTVEEVGGVAPYQDYLLEYAATCVKEEYIHEIEGLAKHSGTEYIEALAANLYYDFVKLLLGCTAFAVNTENGPMHARNMDWFSHGDSLSELTTILNFQDGGTTRFQSVGWPGAVGVLSAMAPGRFTVTLNAVLSDEPIQAATPVALLIREVCQTAENFQEAVEILSTRPITSDCLLLVTGTRPGEMVVIERTPTRHAIRTTDEEFIVVTNDYRTLDCGSEEASGEIYESTCGRYNTAIQSLKANLSSKVEQCFSVLNDEDVKMEITVQQMVMCANTGALEVRTPHHS